MRITLVVSGAGDDSGKSVPSEVSQKSDTQKRDIKPEDDEFVSTVMETFAAQCVRVDPVRPTLEGLGDTTEEMDD
ncbi:MAG: hypothetical protein H8E37_13080 [Planctomycetes bacterium]|nr:hypothetical protein [Planctomycetota bacterium]